MALKIRGFDQITAWATGLVCAGIVFGIAMWIGSNARSREIQEKMEVAKSAEKLLEESVKAGQKHAKDLTVPANAEPVSPTSNQGPSQFGYLGTNAPWRWSDLRAEWKICATGKRQSPIDISGAHEDAKLKPLKFHYQHNVTKITFSNQTYQANVEPGSWLEFDSDRYDLKQVFFRTPGEHRVNGLPYDLEVQLSHQELSGRRLIVSLQYTSGKSNPALKRLSSSLPRFEGEASDVERFIWSDLLPQKKTYWHYTGSLTYPPCTEDVTWIVMTGLSTASTSEIDAFAKLQKNNARPTQALGKRAITRSNR